MGTDVKEAIPSNMPKPNGKTLVVGRFVDHAADQTVRRSRTGFILFISINSAPIIFGYPTRCDSNTLTSV